MATTTKKTQVETVTKNINPEQNKQTLCLITTGKEINQNSTFFGNLTVVNENEWYVVVIETFVLSDSPHHTDTRDTPRVIHIPQFVFHDSDYDSVTRFCEHIETI